MLLFISSCNNDRIEKGKINTLEISNPIDTIVGDKVLNPVIKEIRRNNLEGLIGMNKKYLYLKSKLYEVKEIDQNYFILRQRKRYSEARNFDLLLKTDVNKVIDYIVFNDFLIKDIKRDSVYWIVLLSDFENTNSYWYSRQQIRIKKLDGDFNEIWDFEKDSELFPFDAEGISIGNEIYSFSLLIITGCHMCYVKSDLILSEEGKFISIRQSGKVNSEYLDENVFNKIFETPDL